MTTPWQPELKVGVTQPPDLSCLTHAEKDVLILALWAQVQALTARVEQLLVSHMLDGSTIRYGAVTGNYNVASARRSPVAQPTP